MSRVAPLCTAGASNPSPVNGGPTTFWNNVRRVAYCYWSTVLTDQNDQLPEGQSKLATNMLFMALGALTVSFWGSVVWMAVSAFRIT